MTTHETQVIKLASTPSDDSVPSRSVFEPRPGTELDRRLVRNVTRPTISVHLPPADRRTGAAVIICPGGAFHILAIEEEGFQVAEWLNERGVAAFVLEYRLVPTPIDDEEFVEVLLQFRSGERDVIAAVGSHHEIGIEDGIRAVELVRGRAAEWSLDDTRIGILGFSAGGQVAAGVALHGTGRARPDFCGAIYALQKEPAIAPSDACPLFIALARDDEFGEIMIDSADRLRRAWDEAGRPVEFHCYQAGGHGFGTQRKGTTSDAWLEQFHSWLEFNLALMDAVR
jgi:acetyl esterase/lipase